MPRYDSHRHRTKSHTTLEELGTPSEREYLPRLENVCRHLGVSDERRKWIERTLEDIWHTTRPRRSYRRTSDPSGYNSA